MNPKTKETFNFGDRITVKDYGWKLLDLFQIYNARQWCIRCFRNVKKALRGKKASFSKPDSLADLPDQSSNSEDSGSDGEVNGISQCSVTLAEGVNLYLQTMKTLSIMFLVLSLINIPIYLMYS